MMKKDDFNEGKFFQRENSEGGVRYFIFEIIKIFFLAFFIIIPIRIFLFQPFFVQGSSMESNFKDGEYLIVNELGYKETLFSYNEKKIFSVKPFKELKRGEVVVFRYPNDPEKFFIKRTIGLPKEEISIKDNKVIIKKENETREIILDEAAYLDSDNKTIGNLNLKLKEDEYFLMGDNRQHSHDSRSFGPVKKKYIIGKVLLRAWPLDKIKIYLNDVIYAND